MNACIGHPHFADSLFFSFRHAVSADTDRSRGDQRVIDATDWMHLANTGDSPPATWFVIYLFITFIYIYPRGSISIYRARAIYGCCSCVVYFRALSPPLSLSRVHRSIREFSCDTHDVWIRASKHNFLCWYAIRMQMHTGNGRILM